MMVKVMTINKSKRRGLSVERVVDKKNDETNDDNTYYHSFGSYY